MYGLPNAGKSYLMTRIKSRTESCGEETACLEGVANADLFKDMRDRPVAMPRVILLHFGDQRYLIGSYDDPAVLSQIILKRPIDLTVGIYNPRFQRPLQGEYDILIENPDSKKKPSLW